MYQRAWRLRCNRGNMVSSAQHLKCLLQAGIGVVVHAAQRLAHFNLIADLLVKLKAHCWVDPIFLLFAAAPEYNTSRADVLAVHGDNESRLRRRELYPMFCLRQ